ncbi:hypothetical protein Pelo_7643 [Pelomyxa schiedti]|nr:hypothetical protein Pelo_7643 [Pelomyxa schiedti]
MSSSTTTVLPRATQPILGPLPGTQKSFVVRTGDGRTKQGVSLEAEGPPGPRRAVPPPHAAPRPLSCSFTPLYFGPQNTMSPIPQTITLPLPTSAPPPPPTAATANIYSTLNTTFSNSINPSVYTTNTPTAGTSASTCVTFCLLRGLAVGFSHRNQQQIELTCGSSQHMSGMNKQ